MEPALFRGVVDEFSQVSEVLELACERRLTAVDASPGMLARNRAQSNDPAVRYIEAVSFPGNPTDGTTRCSSRASAGPWLGRADPARR